ncbi:MAG: methyltransferase [Desulfocapsaceae bacterium]|nr:methyltransferase [Desulfocapsaceae bacterium]
MRDLSIRKDENIRVDSLFGGRLVCQQPRYGYRFSIDSILLAHFSSLKCGDSVLDMGCGCGIIGLIMLFRWQMRCQRLVGLEIQPELAALARMNGHLNGFDDKYAVIDGDLRDIKAFFPAESFSRVVCNPPYYVEGSGRESADRQSLIARHQVCSSTDQIMAAAFLAVKNRGTVSVVFPADGLIELICSMVSAGLSPKRIQVVYSYPEPSAAATLVLVEAVKNGGPGTRILPPFYVYHEKNGSYSDTMKSLYDLHWEQRSD